MDYDIREMTIDDYDKAVALWEAAEGVGLSDGDERDGVALCLERNPSLSFVACAGNRLVGAVLCGHDGRRGYLYHLAVAGNYRNRGIGRALVDTCLRALATAGIRKCSIVLFSHNREAKTFWEKIGWFSRDDLHVMQKAVQGS